MKRYLSVWFPDWALTRLRRAKRRQAGKSHPRHKDEAPEPVYPFVLIEEGAHGVSVAAANPSARKLGVHEGLGLPDARARCPYLKYEAIDRDADRQALKAIGAWMIRGAPLVAIDGSDGLMLETTGCAHLYGGEAGMLETVSALLDRDGLPHQLGLAGTPGAASALAHTRPGSCLAQGGEADGLAELPVTALRLSAEAVGLLKRFGLIRIGQLYGIDRKALARRFQSTAIADAVLVRLDQALGLRHEPVHTIMPQAELTCKLVCPEPLLAKEGLVAGLETLAGQLCKVLSARGEGARGYTFHAFLAEGGVRSVSISLARPVRTAAHVLRLFDEKIDRIDPGFGIDLLMLEAHRTGPMDVSVPALSGDLAAGAHDPVMLSALADRLTARLGGGIVSLMRQVESHVPEEAEVRGAFDGELATSTSEAKRQGPRPLRLLEPPEVIKVMAEVPDGPPLRFSWRRISHEVVRADGPERIAPEWWRHDAPPQKAANPPGIDRKWLAPKLDPRADAELIAQAWQELESIDEAVPFPSLPRARDYYRVEDAAGRRFWLFRDGLYGDGRGGSPDWYIHGLFA